MAGTISDIGVPGQPLSTPPLTEWQAAVRDFLNSGGATGPAGPPGVAYLSAQWNFNQTITVSPNSGTMRMNATTYAATTQLWVHEVDRDGIDRHVGLDQVADGDQIIMQSAQGRAVWQVNGHADSGTYRTLTVSLLESSGGRPSASSPTTLYFANQGSDVGLPGRETVSIDVPSLAPGSGAVGVVTMAKGYRLLSLTTTAPCRLRLYTTTAKRDADVSRALGTDPTGNHGLMLEFCTTASLLAADLSPTVDGFTSGSPDVAFTIINTAATASPVVVNLSWIRTE